MVMAANGGRFALGDMVGIQQKASDATRGALLKSGSDGDMGSPLQWQQICAEDGKPRVVELEVLSETDGIVKESRIHIKVDDEDGLSRYDNTVR